MAGQYARAAAQITVVQLAEAAGFDAVQKSSVDVLSDLLLRYISEIGRSSHAYAELGGRTESNPLDVMAALEELGASVPKLQRYAELVEVPFGQAIAGFPVHKRPRHVQTFADLNEAPPPHVPPFMPAYPDKHAYLDTATFSGHPKDAAQRQTALVELEEGGKTALARLQARLVGDANLVLAEAVKGEGGAAAGAAGGEKGGDGVAAACVHLQEPVWEGGAVEGIGGPSGTSRPSEAPHSALAGSMSIFSPSGGEQPRPVHFQTEVDHSLGKQLTAPQHASARRAEKERGFEEDGGRGLKRGSDKPQRVEHILASTRGAQELEGAIEEDADVMEEQI